MIPPERLKELLRAIYPEAVRLPPGWLRYARLVEAEVIHYYEARLTDALDQRDQVRQLLRAADNKLQAIAGYYGDDLATVIDRQREKIAAGLKGEPHV